MENQYSDDAIMKMYEYERGIRYGVQFVRKRERTRLNLRERGQSHRRRMVGEEAPLRGLGGGGGWI